MTPAGWIATHKKGGQAIALIREALPAYTGKGWDVQPVYVLTEAEKNAIQALREGCPMLSIPHLNRRIVSLDDSTP